MRSFVVVMILALALPIVVADHGAPDHSFGGIDIDGRYYISICANNDTELLDGDWLEDCLQTGVWEDTNVISALQVRAGVYHNTAYSADTRLLA